MDADFLRSLENSVMCSVTRGEDVTRQLISSDLLHTMDGLISLPGTGSNNVVPTFHTFSATHRTGEVGTGSVRYRYLPSCRQNLEDRENRMQNFSYVLHVLIFAVFRIRRVS